MASILYTYNIYMPVQVIATKPFMHNYMYLPYKLLHLPTMVKSVSYTIINYIKIIYISGNQVT